MEEQPNCREFCLKWENIGAKSRTGKLGIKPLWHRDLHKIPSSLISPESCQLNSSLFPGGGISLLWLLKAILLSSLKSSCACAQRGHSQKELFARHPEWLGAGEGRCWSGAAPGGIHRLFWEQTGCEHPSPSTASWLFQLQNHSNWELWQLQLVPSSPGCMESVKEVPARDARAQDFLLL